MLHCELFFLSGSTFYTGPKQIKPLSRAHLSARWNGTSRVFTVPLGSTSTTWKALFLTDLMVTLFSPIIPYPGEISRAHLLTLKAATLGPFTAVHTWKTNTLTYYLFPTSSEILGTQIKKYTLKPVVAWIESIKAYVFFSVYIFWWWHKI